MKGPKGELSWDWPDKMKVSVNEGIVSVERSGDTKNEKALHGLTRSLIFNMVFGVSQGYQKVLDITGVGYKAQVAGDKIVLTLGYSHAIEFQLPEGIKASVGLQTDTDHSYRHRQAKDWAGRREPENC